jgi:2',3'-cyclic-nucleotide 2'-phosphodiesterase (5'-nucleotidase family)
MSRVIALTDSGGAPLDTNQVYRVAVNDFMATGGDEYDVLSSSGRDRKNTGIAVRDVLETFVVDRGAKGPLDYVSDGRIQRVGRRPERASD